jgi:tetratricopeptide (TPR) repeat protein
MPEFKDILRQIRDKHGMQAFTDGENCKALLKDYAAGEYQNEQRLFSRMLDAGGVQAILDSGEPDITQKQLALQLEKDMLVAEKSAVDMVKALAWALRGDEDYIQAEELSLARNAASAMGDAAEALFKRGLAYIEKGQYESAIADLSEVIRLHPDSAPAFYSRGTAYNEKGQYDYAIADFSEVIRLTPDYAAAFHNRGLAYNGKGQYDRAIADCTEAIRLHPDFALAFISRGTAYNEKGQYDRAIADFTKAIRLNPDFAAVFFNGT